MVAYTSAVISAFSVSCPRSRLLAADHFFYLAGELLEAEGLGQEMELAVAVAWKGERELLGLRDGHQAFVTAGKFFCPASNSRVRWKFPDFGVGIIPLRLRELEGPVRQGSGAHRTPNIGTFIQ
jgi:hypothetical protein